MHLEADPVVDGLSRFRERVRASWYGVLLPGLLLLTSCSLIPKEFPSVSFKSMGTRATVTVSAEYRSKLPRLSAEVQAAFEKLESLFSTYRSDSEISRLGAAAGKAPLPLSEDTFRILDLSKRYGEVTQGAFDVTVAPLVRLWGFGAVPPSHVPEPQVIEERLRRVDFRRLELRGGHAFLPAGMSVDLGGIGKGYAVDRAFEIARRLGVNAAMLDLGGNIRVIGQAGKGTRWTIGVRNPFAKEQILGKISLPDGAAVATSGDYERFVEIGDRRFSHIIDPRTGYPVEAMAGVTVVAPDATMSDALSTGLFVLGIKSGRGILRSFPGVEAIFIPDRDPIRIHVTKGMTRLFVPLPEFASSVTVEGDTP